ncbi:MAG: TetR/AcrR family transcriptional regulator [Solirubrobacteraceae bacterium]|nr:TetR/AcrR family transcriptional regulator [Patulibacter sp.]
MPDAPVRLPRGRHNLSREEVAESQRERLLEATVEVVGSEGYAATTVSKILRLAGVSRETFYENFANKTDALNAAHRSESDALRDQILDAQRALPADAAPLERIDSAVGCYLDRLSAHRQRARALLVEILAAGPDSVELAVGARRRFVEMAVAILGFDTPELRFSCEAYLAAVNGTAMQCALTGRADEIGALREPLSGLARSILIGVDRLGGPSA